MKSKKRVFTVVGSCLFSAIGLLGCSSDVSEANLPRSREVAPVSVDTTGAGYVHSLANSKFHLGAVVGQKSELGFSKTIGAEGVFATVVHSGWVIASANSDASSKGVGPLTSSGDAHNKVVLDYFVAAGLPSAQVSTVVAHASMHQSKAMGEAPEDPVFDSYTSVISRQISGIPVAESFAWASFNANGEVVAESVYWPPIPTGAIQEATAFRDFVADPSVPHMRSGQACGDDLG